MKFELRISASRRAWGRTGDNAHDGARFFRELVKFAQAAKEDSGVCVVDQIRGREKDESGEEAEDPEHAADANEIRRNRDGL